MKIAIFHYRVGKTDGVSLEIEKRKQILENLGHKVSLIAGPVSDNATYTIRELEWDGGIAPTIKENAFSHFDKDNLSNNQTKRKIQKTTHLIYKKLCYIQHKEHFDYVLIHNIFSFGGHISAAKAFYKWIEKFKIPCLATHHDFYWEKKEYTKTKSKYTQNYLKKHMPPKSEFIEHITINSIAREELEKRTGIEAQVLGDVFDFNQKPWRKDDFNKDFLAHFDIGKNDIVILQATRIVPRKGIELAIDYVAQIQNNLKKLQGKTLYNGKKITADSKVVFLLAGYAEKEDCEYVEKLKKKIKEKNITAKFISNHIEYERSANKNSKKFSLWDSYVFSDIVTFPSLWEGWGNQFLEAVFAKKPVVLFEYPVFEKDIKPEGYKVISLGRTARKCKKTGLFEVSQKTIQQSAHESIDWIFDKKLHKILRKNFQIGKDNHDYAVLRDLLTRKIQPKTKKSTNPINLIKKLKYQQDF